MIWTDPLGAVADSVADSTSLAPPPLHVSARSLARSTLNPEPELLGTGALTLS